MTSPGLRACLIRQKATVESFRRGKIKAIINERRRSRWCRAMMRWRRKSRATAVNPTQCTQARKLQGLLFSSNFAIMAADGSRFVPV